MNRIVFCWGALLDDRGDPTDDAFFPVEKITHVLYENRCRDMGSTYSDIRMIAVVQYEQGFVRYLVPKRRLQDALTAFNGGLKGLFVDPLEEKALVAPEVI
jgi:hypothetical protein